MELKSKSKLPRDFPILMSKVANQYGFQVQSDIVDEQSWSIPSLDYIKSIEVQLLLLEENENLSFASEDSQIDVEMVSKLTDKILHEIYYQISQKPRVFFSTKKLSHNIQPSLFLTSEEENQTLLSAENTIDFYANTNQAHLIPDYTLAHQDKVKHLRINIFDASNLAASSTSFRRNTG